MSPPFNMHRWAQKVTFSKNSIVTELTRLMPGNVAHSKMFNVSMERCMVFMVISFNYTLISGDIVMGGQPLIVLEEWARNSKITTAFL